MQPFLVYGDHVRGEQQDQRWQRISGLAEQHGLHVERTPVGTQFHLGADLAGSLHYEEDLAEPSLALNAITRYGRGHRGDVPALSIGRGFVYLQATVHQAGIEAPLSCTLHLVRSFGRDDLEVAAMPAASGAGAQEFAIHTEQAPGAFVGALEVAHGRVVEGGVEG